MLSNVQENIFVSSHTLYDPTRVIFVSPTKFISHTLGKILKKRVFYETF